jgi:hypothetical protein
VHIIRIVDIIETHEVGNDIYGDRKDNGAVVLGRDAIESLKITQLKIRKY